MKVRLTCPECGYTPKRRAWKKRLPLLSTTYFCASCKAELRVTMAGLRKDFDRHSEPRGVFVLD